MVPLFLGGLISGFSKIFGGNSERKQYRAQAQAKELNAQLVDKRTDVEKTLRAREGVKEAGTISADTGAQGVNLAGSAADILRESARNTAYDVNSIGEQGALEANVLRAEAGGLRKAGKRSFIGGLIGGAADILGF